MEFLKRVELLADLADLLSTLVLVSGTYDDGDLSKFQAQLRMLCTSNIHHDVNTVCLGFYSYTFINLFSLYTARAKQDTIMVQSLNYE